MPTDYNCKKKSPKYKFWNFLIWKIMYQTMVTIEYVKITLQDDPESDIENIHELLGSAVG